MIHLNLALNKHFTLHTIYLLRLLNELLKLLDMNK